MLSHGANAALQNSKGLTAEMIAQWKGHSRVVELLRVAETSIRPVVETLHEESDNLDLGDAPSVTTSADESEALN